MLYEDRVVAIHHQVDDFVNILHAPSPKEISKLWSTGLLGESSCNRRIASQNASNIWRIFAIPQA